MNGVITADNCVAAAEVIGWRSVCPCAHTHVINVITAEVAIVTPRNAIYCRPSLFWLVCQQGS